MSYSITNLKTDLEAMLHGTTLDKVQSIDNLIYRAARNLLSDADYQETKRTVLMANPIYSQVYDYALPVDVKGNRIIDIRPQVNRLPQDRFIQQYGQEFDLNKAFTNQDSFSVNFNSGVKTIRVNDPLLQSGVTINTVDSVTTNGTWSTGDNASNVSVDNVNFAAGVGSLKFDLAGGTNGYLENSTMTAVDLTEFLNQGSLFYYVYLPTASAFTSVGLRFGSDSSNYWEYISTMTQQNTVFQDGWNLIAVPWASATKVGSPDVANIDYLRVNYIYSGVAQTAVRLDNIVVRMGQLMEISYYSKYLFRDYSTGAWQETVTDDSNLVNLDTDSYNLLLSMCMILIAQQVQGIDALSYDGSFYQNEYAKNLGTYVQLYKSEVQKPSATYYKTKNPNFSKFVNRRFNY